MYRVILFDLDGTLTDSKEGILNCLRYVFEKLGDPVPSEERLLPFIGPPLKESFMNFCGYSEEKAVLATQVYRERYAPLGKFENAPAPGMEQMLKELKEKGYRLALASSKPEEMCIPICEKYGFTPSLEVIAGSPSHGDHTKADVIRDAMARMGLTDADKPQILMVGDRKFDVLGAKECGIDCVGVEFFGYAAPNELQDAGAVAVVSTAEELEQFILAH